MPVARAVPSSRWMVFIRYGCFRLVISTDCHYGKAGHTQPFYKANEFLYKDKGKYIRLDPKPGNDCPERHRSAVRHRESGVFFVVRGRYEPEVR